VEIMAEDGVGGLTVTAVAQRMNVRGPSLYKYFPSLHAIYDSLFARGAATSAQAIATAVEGLPRGTARIRAAAHATVRWCMENQALAQLLYWRPVPGFVPSPEAFAVSLDDMKHARAEFGEAVRRGQLSTGVDIEEAIRVFTVLLSGIITQQMANEPGATYTTGVFTALTDQALDMFFAHYGP
jgi:AcrR family transcriptional regulator